jgi:hypothetical protein
MRGTTLPSGVSTLRPFPLRRRLARLSPAGEYEKVDVQRRSWTTWLLWPSLPRAVPDLVAIKGECKRCQGLKRHPGSPCQGGDYAKGHGLLQAMLEQIPGMDDCDFAAHALLAAVRADLAEQRAGREGVPRKRLRAQLANFTNRVIGSPSLQSAR